MFDRKTHLGESVEGIDMPHKGIVSRKLFACMFALYTLNVFGKTAFSAVTVELVNASIMTKTEAGLINGMFWLAYAIGQMIGGVIVSKVSPYRMLYITFGFSALANALFVAFDSFVPMLIIWTLNGFMQFGMWPSILGLVSTELLPTHRAKGMARFAYCYAFGSILSYLLTSIILLFWPWQAMFIGCALVNFGSLFIVYHMDRCYSPVLRSHGTSLPKESEAKKPRRGKPKGRLSWQLAWGGGFILFCAMILLRNITDTCIKNWMPTILTETYGADPSFTLILSVVLLALNVVGVACGAFFYKKLKRDEARTLFLMIGLSLPMAIALIGFLNYPLLLTTALMIGITFFMYAAGQIMTLNYPNRFQAFGLTALVGGVLNGFAALGNVIASFGGGFVADNFGWKTLIFLWIGLLAASLLIAAVTVPIWKKFRQRNP